MLAAVAIIAVLCALCAGLRQRARVQDSLIAEIEGRGNLVYLERWGPKWLDLVGAERFRRRIVGVDVYNYDNSTGVGLLNRLGQLPELQLLYIRVEEWTPDMAAALGNLRQLRTLGIEETLRVEEIESTPNDIDEPGSDAVLAAIGKLRQLDVLSVSCGLIKPDSLRHLADLTSLRSLDLVIEYNGETEQEMQHLVTIGKRATLADLSVLPQLEFMGFHGGLVRAEDLRQLASFRRLKALDLQTEFVSDGALVELASLEALEELAVGNAIVSSGGLESLASLNRIERLHIPSPFLNETPLRVDSTGEVFVRQSDLARCRRALEAVRHANPGIVIDSGGSRPFAEYRSTLDEMRAGAMFVHRWPQ